MTSTPIYDRIETIDRPETFEEWLQRTKIRRCAPKAGGQRKRRKLLRGNPHLLRSKKYKKHKS